MDAVEQAQRAAVIAEAHTWLHTPFRHASRIKGRRGGVDCGQILAGVYENSGVVAHVTTPDYQMQWALHRYQELYLAELLKYTREITESEVLPADIVVYKVAHCYAHGAILLAPWPGLIIHAINGLGIQYSDASKEGFLRSVTKRAGAVPCRFFSPWPVAPENLQK
jgi:cell wall-associated NlpC family hydrolase